MKGIAQSRTSGKRRYIKFLLDERGEVLSVFYVLGAVLTLRVLLGYLELNPCSKCCVACSPKYSLFGPLHTVFADPCSKVLPVTFDSFVVVVGPILQAIIWPDFWCCAFTFPLAHLFISSVLVTQFMVIELMDVDKNKYPQSLPSEVTWFF